MFTGGHYQCSVPPSLVPSMAAEEENGTCNPIVECDVDDPYDSPKSVLAEAHCKGFIGDLSLTFWSYLTLR